MWSDVNHHKLAYLLLLVELVIFVALFLAAWPNRVLQRGIILELVIFYVVWGVLTHRKLSHPLKQVSLEYLGVAGLAGTILFILTI